jgi:hypothetical protein
LSEFNIEYEMVLQSTCVINIDTCTSILCIYMVTLFSGWLSNIWLDNQTRRNGFISIFLKTIIFFRCFLNLLEVSVLYHVHVVTEFCDRVYSFEWKRICAGFLLFVYIGIGEPIIKKGRVEIRWTNLTLSHCYAWTWMCHGLFLWSHDILYARGTHLCLSLRESCVF